MEPVAVGGEGAEKDVMAAIILDAVSDDARAPIIFDANAPHIVGGFVGAKRRHLLISMS